MPQDVLEWFDEHGALLTALAATSVVVFVASLLIAPAVVIRIPSDYFAHDKRPPGMWDHRHPVLRLVLRIGKNVLGCVFLVAGLAMLVLPGQGLLTALIGFLLLDFPGKYRLEKWLVSRRGVLKSINWLRKRRGREPLSRMADISAAPENC